jgi:peptidoglycan hydrolase CwlO-like protein
MSYKWFFALIAAIATLSATDAVADTFSCASITTSADTAITHARETTSRRHAVETFNALAPLIEGACRSEISSNGDITIAVLPKAASGPGPEPRPTTPPHPSPTPTPDPNCKAATDAYLRMQSLLANAQHQLDDLKKDLKAKQLDHRSKKPAVDTLTEQHRIVEGLYARAVARIAALYPKWEATLHLYKHWDGSWSGWISKYPRTDWVKTLDKYEDDLHRIAQKLAPLLAELNSIAREIVKLKAEVKQGQENVDRLERLQKELYDKMNQACKR